MPRYFIPVDDDKTASVDFEGFGSRPPLPVLDYWKTVLSALINEDDVFHLISDQKAFRIPDESGDTVLTVRFEDNDMVCEVKRS